MIVHNDEHLWIRPLGVCQVLSATAIGGQDLNLPMAKARGF